MADSRTGNEAADKIVADYEQALQIACARALDGQITQRQLQESLYLLSIRYLTMLYVLGGGSLQNANGQRWLRQQETIHKRSARKLASDVFNGHYRGDDGTTQ